MTEGNDKKPTPYNLPGNSHKKREEQEQNSQEAEEIAVKKVTKITSGKVVQKKKPLGQRIAETFTGDDARSVGHYILFEVVIPAAKNTLSDAVSQGIERMLFGGEARSRSSSRSGGSRTNYTSYGRMYTSGQSRKPELSYKARSRHDFDELYFESRDEADEVLEGLEVLVDQYGQAKVSDLLDLVGLEGSFADDKWGWTDLRGSQVRKTRNEYHLMLPKTEPLD